MLRQRWGDCSTLLLLSAASRDDGGRAWTVEPALLVVCRARLSWSPHLNKNSYFDAAIIRTAIGGREFSI